MHIMSAFGVDMLYECLAFLIAVVHVRMCFCIAAKVANKDYYFYLLLLLLLLLQCSDQRRYRKYSTSHDDFQTFRN